MLDFRVKVRLFVFLWFDNVIFRSILYTVSKNLSFFSSPSQSGCWNKSRRTVLLYFWNYKENEVFFARKATNGNLIIILKISWELYWSLSNVQVSQFSFSRTLQTKTYIRNHHITYYPIDWFYFIVIFIASIPIVASIRHTLWVVYLWGYTLFKTKIIVYYGL